MKKVFRVAVVGCGAICANHINGILASGEEICALCDIDASAAESAAEKFSLNTNIYTDYIGMLEAEHPDSVHICTPHYLHAKMCIEALARGINVLCEKPLCISEEELAEIIKAAGESKAQLGVCLQNRYEPAILKLRELAGDDPVGALGIVSWNRDEKYYASGEWRGKWDTEGGGVMINQAIHTLDLLQWICGMPVCVTAHVSNDSLQGIIEVEDTASALFECENGKRINFFATNACGASFPAQLHIKNAEGEKLYADTKLVMKNGVPEAFDVPSEKTVGKAVWGKGHALLIRDFYSCLDSGKPFPIDAKEGGKVVRLVLSMYKSNGERIEII